MNMEQYTQSNHPNSDYKINSNEDKPKQSKPKSKEKEKLILKVAMGNTYKMQTITYLSLEYS